MAISRMQEPQQIQSGIGSLQDPRQGYFLGKLVKKAGRAVKKIVKSPIGKMALLGGIGYGLGGAKFLGGEGIFKGGQGMGRFSNLLNLVRTKGIGGEAAGKRGALAGLFYDKDDKFSLGRAAMTGLAGTAMAAPFFMGGDEEEEDVDIMDIGSIRNSAANYYSGLGDKGAGLAFMPQKEYVQPNFYAAAGGRARLNMGGGPGNAQAEQMLMAEYVKYKNRGGTLSFEQFVKAVMQAQQAPEGAGMEQPEAVQMAANGGRIGYAGGQLVSPSNDGSRPGYKGLSNMFVTPGPDSKRTPRNKFDFLHTTGPMTENEKEILKNMTEEDWAEADKGGFVDIIIDILKTPYIIRGGEDDDWFNKRDGGRIGAYNGGFMEDEDETTYNPYKAMAIYKRQGKQEGGIMETEEASELIDMDGQEKDYRETGGFVDLGGQERADDVPARLSKNEFVFTADAVRNAGGGDIDKGAEVMENLMNNLESGGEVSEDSQGLEGAQAMYDQQQMLQSRVV